MQIEYDYKELLIPSGANNSYLIEKEALHIWPRGNFMVIALANLDGSFTCTLFAAKHGKDSFENLWSLYGAYKIPLLRLKDQTLSEIKEHQGGIIICTYSKLHRMRVNTQNAPILEYIRSKSKFIVSVEKPAVNKYGFVSE